MLKFLQKIVNFKIELSHTAFILIYATLHYIIFNLINPNIVAKWFWIADKFDYFGFIAWLTIGLLLFIAVTALFAHKYTSKIFAILTLVLSTASAYFISKYNIAIDETMIINILHTDPIEARGLLSTNMIPYIIFFIILPMIIIFKTKITYKKISLHILKTVIIIVTSLLLVIVLAYLSFATLLRVGNTSHKYALYSLVPDNYLGVSLDMTAHHFLDKKKEKKKIKDFKAIVTKKEDLIVVLAIGEAARQRSFSLYGYDRVNTNPLLSKIKNLHTLNAIARLGSTFYALPEILEKDDIKLTNITFNADINTSCYVNFSLYDNCVKGEIQAKDYNGDGVYDEDVVPLLEKDLNTYNGGEKLILLHLGGGSHGAIYNTRFPASFRKFQPYCNDADVLKQCTKEELFNEYDNSILYTDFVLNEIIQKLQKSKLPYVFIYTSDHGESLGEDGYIFHGMPPGVALPYDQAHIPLLVKASIPISILKREEYKQPDIFDTVLYLLNIQTDGFDKKRNFIKKER